MKNLTFYCIFVFSLIFLISCESEVETVDKASFKYAYFPLIIGSTYIYDSDSILIGNGGQYRDTLRSQIREIVKDTFRSADNELIYTIDRYFRRTDKDEWSPINRWVASANADLAYRAEENLKFIKFVFPPELGRKWDANEFDEYQKIAIGNELIEMYTSWKSKIVDVDGKVTIQGKEYSALQVNLVDFSTSIGLRNANEWYADGVGLVRREIAIYDGDSSRPGDPWEIKAKKGFVHTLVLKEFTK